jgi:octaprenyl-diphosphate synthase
MLSVDTTRLSLEKILSPVSEELHTVELHIREALETGFPEMDQCSSFVVESGGKRVRASLVLLCSSLRGALPDGVHRLAAGAEMVHAATLLHDDVIDQASTRRGHPTVSHQWGNRIAVLLGDYMLAKALDVAVSINRRDLYSPLADAAKGMVMGEFLQSRCSGISDVSEKIYFEIIEKKTGSFMGACAFLGGAYADFPAEECEQLRLFGSELGAAFQIIDDTLDYVSESSKTGKDQGNDFFTGKVTLPVIYAMEILGPEGRDLLVSHFQNPTDHGWTEVRRSIEECGAIGRCTETARMLSQRAASRLAGFPDCASRRILTELSCFIVERVY